MISVVKYLSENDNEAVESIVDFLKTRKQVKTPTKTPTPFATQSIYNTPAGQESGDQLLSKLGK